MIGGGYAEMAGKILELVEEQTGRPEIGTLVAQMGRAPAAELIIVDDGAP